MTVYPCIKVNLGLNVLRKRPDGYHDLETLFVPSGEYHDVLEEPAAFDVFLVQLHLLFKGNVAPARHLPYAGYARLYVQAFALLERIVFHFRGKRGVGGRRGSCCLRAR